MKNWKKDMYRLTKKNVDKLKPVLSVGWKHFSDFPVVKQLVEMIVTAFQMFKDVGESWRKSPLNLIIQWVNLFLSFIVFLAYFPEVISAHYEAFAQLDPLHQKMVSAFLGYIVGKFCPSTLQNVFKTTMRQSVLLLAIYLGRLKTS